MATTRSRVKEEVNAQNLCGKAKESRINALAKCKLYNDERERGKCGNYNKQEWHEVAEYIRQGQVNDRYARCVVATGGETGRGQGM